MKLSNDELYSVSGGGIGWGIAGLIAGIITFVVGVIDGYMRPLKCNQKGGILLNDAELTNVVGGAISATLFNALVRGFTAIFEFGKAVGTAIRRAKTGTICSI